MTPEKINTAREWLAGVRPVKPGDLPPQIQEIVDTIEEALELAMEKALTEARETAEQAEWRRLVDEQAAGLARQAKATGTGS